jgi:UDP-N-acetyl-D-mannosaminuronic acid dehydrogenase
LPDEVTEAIIAVGTIDDSNPAKPSLCDLIACVEAVATRLTQDATVIVRSTVPVGTCRGTLAPILSRNGKLVPGSAFSLAYAPDRSVEGAILTEAAALPQIIGGYTNRCGTSALRILCPPLQSTTPLSLEAAELAKLANNAYRDISFAFANELTEVARRFDVNPTEVIGAANYSYPRAAIPSPSPGVGGSCLPKDSRMFADAARLAGVRESLASTARWTNEQASYTTVRWLLSNLEALGVRAPEASIAIAGAAFKSVPPTPDIRNSPGIHIATELGGRCADVRIHDPVARCRLPTLARSAGSIMTLLKDANAVLVVSHDEAYRLELVRAASFLLAPPRLLFDPWGRRSTRSIAAEAGLTYSSCGVIVDSLRGEDTASAPGVASLDV